MEINFNTNGGKFAKHDSLMMLAENVDQKGKALAYLFELRELDIEMIAKLYEENMAITQGAFADLVKLIGDTLPTKYRPSFSNEAFKIVQKIKRSYEVDTENITDDYTNKIADLKAKYGFDE